MKTIIDQAAADCLSDLAAAQFLRERDDEGKKIDWYSSNKSVEAERIIGKYIALAIKDVVRELPCQDAVAVDDFGHKCCPHCTMRDTLDTYLAEKGKP